MDIQMVDLTALDRGQRAAVGALLCSAFPAEPAELLEVELGRAADPRLGRGLVAVASSAVVGGLLARRACQGSVFVVYLATAEQHRRRRVARTLLDRLTATTGARVELFVSDGNVAAERLYTFGGLAPDGGPAPAGQHRWSGVWQPTTCTPSRDEVGV